MAYSISLPLHLQIPPFLPKPRSLQIKAFYQPPLSLARNLHCQSLKREKLSKNPSYPNQFYAFENPLNDIPTKNETPTKSQSERREIDVPSFGIESKFLWGIFPNTWWATVRGDIGQRFNPEGISCAATVISRDRHLLLPHVTVPDITCINWLELRRLGFKGVVFDKDNTLTLPYALTLWDPLKPSLDLCKTVFGEKNVAVFSNSAGLTEFDPDESKAGAVERAIGLRVIRHRLKKPAGSVEEIEKQLGCRSDELVMIGDRQFLDVVYGNRNGFLTILTKPLSDKGEPFVVWVIRRVEGFLVRKWIRDGVRPIDHYLLPCSEAHVVCLKETM